MKKIFLLFLLIFAVGCENPFDKYKKSVDDVQAILEANLAAAGRVEAQVTTISNLLTANGGSFSPASMDLTEVQSLNNALSAILTELNAKNLDVLLSQASSYPEETTQILAEITTYKNEVDSVIASYPDGDPRKAEMQSALNNALDIISYMNNYLG